MGKPSTLNLTLVPIFSLALSKSQTVSKYLTALNFWKWENETYLPGGLQGLNWGNACENTKYSTSCRAGAL